MLRFFAWLHRWSAALERRLTPGGRLVAGTAALAMELRGLSAASGKGSAWRVPRPGRRDAVFVALAVLLLVTLRMQGAALG